MAVLVGGWIAQLMAQAPMPLTQDGLNALLFERMRAIESHQATIDGMLKVALAALFANLGAHLFSIWSVRTSRSDDKVVKER